ncbi:MAG: 3-isopropylmalate dehydratase small subunit [Alphaproteobacteria bacterium]|nr:MAG: 3-isopropylmalate dehydratase small subunit [Alphaproteobacteria bacterium]
MTPFRVEAGLAAPLLLDNVDTDQLLPARFLRKPRGDGYHPWLFYDARYDAEGVPNPGFVLNQAPWQSARFLLSGANFGCGSSREGAVYALVDAGIRAVLAPSFGDIFFNNACKNGLLPVRLAPPQLSTILNLGPVPITVDLEALAVRLPSGETLPFSLDPLARASMLEGLDDIGLTDRYADAIQRFDQTRPRWLDIRSCP